MSIDSRTLVLASASPRRRELLAKLGVTFEVQVASVVEHEDPTTDPREMVRHNAALKADCVADARPEATVLGADTTVFVDGHALNKPTNLDEARSMLRRLSGRAHTVFTGLAIRRRFDGLSLDQGVGTQVFFKALDEERIDAYLQKVHVLDKAGAYAVQEHGELIIAGWQGSWSNIVGLPLAATKVLLTRAGHPVTAHFSSNA